MVLKRKYLLRDRYRIEETLGQGGMGAVYRARDENLGMEVAVKENLYFAEEFTRQFSREANILATLRHPNLPRVFDHFEISGQGQYLVMDYIEGEDLRQRMDRLGILSEKEMIILGAGICDALEFLHTRTPPIFHRDIKPGNIKINPEGGVYLVDFGLAKIAEGSQATTTGARAMTPGYSSPEQYGTARTDARSDIYSLGATLYAALTGAISEDGLARAMQRADLTPVRKRNPKISRRLAQVIEKALEVHPEDRYQTADEFKLGLLSANSPAKRQVEAGEMTVPPPPQEVIQAIAEGKEIRSQPLTQPEINGESLARKRRKRRQQITRRFWAYTISTFLLCLVVLLSYYSLIPDQIRAWVFSAPVATEAVDLAATTDSRSQAVDSTIQATISPVAPSPSPSSQATLPAINVPITAEPAKPSLQSLTRPDDEFVITFASDRTGIPQIWLYFFEDQHLEQLTDERRGACQPSWSIDRTRLAFVSPCNKNDLVYTSSSIYILNLANPTKPERLEIDTGGFDPVWSPVDPDVLLFSFYEDANSIQIYMLNVATNEMIQMTESGSNHNINPAWSPDGSQIAFISTRLAGYRIYLMSNIPQSQAVGISRSGSNNNYFPDWALDGTHILFAQKPAKGSGVFNIFSLDVDMVRVTDILDYYETRISHLLAPESDPEYSPDGNWIIFESWPNGENHDIYFMRADGALRTAIDTSPSQDFHPTWMPMNQ